MINMSKFYLIYFICVLCILFVNICAVEQTKNKIICQVECIENNNRTNHENICSDKCNNLLLNDDNEGSDDKYNINFGEDLSDPILHCLTDDTMTVSWQPWHLSQQNIIYFVQIQNNKFQWIYSTTTTHCNITVENLDASSEYQVQLWAIGSRKEHAFVLGPRNSKWITTLPANYTPKPVTNISLNSLIFVNGNFKAVVQWIPDFDEPACYYELVYFLSHGDSGDYTQIEFTEANKPFQIVLEESEFDSNISIGIMSKSKDWENESPTVTTYFLTPSCLDIIGNLTICAPNQPMNVTSEELIVDVVNGDTGHIIYYDITIFWGEPKYIPDYYIVTLHYLNSNSTSNLRLNSSVPGEELMVTFKHVDIGLRYLATVVAYSNGGSSEPAILQRQMTHPQLPITMKHMWVVTLVGIIAIILLIIFGGGICIYHRRAKRKRYERRCKYFEDLDEKTAKTIDCNTSGIGLIIDDTHNEFDKWEIRPERLVLQSVLGEGAFGLVRRAWLWDEKGSSSTEVAVKMLKDAPSVEQARQFIHEIEIMKTVGIHPNLVSLIGCCTRPKPDYGANMLLIVEFCALGDLQNYLRSIWDSMTSRPEPSNLKYADLVSPTSSEGSTNLIINKLYDIDVHGNDLDLKPHDLLSFARQIAVGMEFLSSNKVIHRDLAARNVLVCTDKTVKIADFGLSRDVYKENLYRKTGNGRLPIRWMAIESLTHQLYTTQSDVWSFGILLWEIVTLGGNPYPSIPTNALLKYLKSGYRMERPTNCGQELYSIMISCWKVRPKDRPTFIELRKSLDNLLESMTNSKYLDLDVLTSTEFASFRTQFKDNSSLSLKSKNRSIENICTDRYVHPIMLNNAKNTTTGPQNIPIIIK